jgi:hypothetical protein
MGHHPQRVSRDSIYGEGDFAVPFGLGHHVTAAYGSSDLLLRFFLLLATRSWSLLHDSCINLLGVFVHLIIMVELIMEVINFIFLGVFYKLEIANRFDVGILLIRTYILILLNDLQSFDVLGVGTVGGQVTLII